MNAKNDVPIKAPSQTYKTASSARSVTDGEIVLATVDVAVPAERVFRALTTDEAERWWGAPGVYRTEEWKADVRVGGQWSLVTRLPDGTALPASGEFLQVERPSKLVTTRRYDFEYPNLGRRVTKVTYVLAPIEGGTRVTVRHEDFGHSQPAFEHAGGWERLLDWLGAYLNAGCDFEENVIPTPTVSLGANSKFTAARSSDRERVQGFYRDVLGCRVESKADADLVWLRPDFYLGIVYEQPALDEADLLKGIWLELRTGQPEELKTKILKFGLKPIDYALDVKHFYFQAPGGQVFRLVSQKEELNLYRPHHGAADAP